MTLAPKNLDTQPLHCVYAIQRYLYFSQLEIKSISENDQFRTENIVLITQMTTVNNSQITTITYLYKLYNNTFKLDFI